jgi:hypothetical protein
MNIQLSDERIDAMRERVVSDADADVQQRGRRARKAVAGGIGALVLVTVLGISLPTLSGGGSDPDVMTSQQADGGTTAALPEPAVAGRGSADELSAKEAPESSYADGISPPDPQPPLTAPGKDREVITTGSANVTVKDTAKAANRFTAWVEQHDGRVDARSESRDNEGHTSAHVTARIPSKHVTAAVAELRTQGELTKIDPGTKFIVMEFGENDPLRETSALVGETCVADGFLLKYKQSPFFYGTATCGGDTVDLLAVKVQLVEASP